MNDFTLIRDGMKGLPLNPRTEASDQVTRDRIFFPERHRSVLDFRRQLVIGNRGMGKSFWTHALSNPELRDPIADIYNFLPIKTAQVVVGFDGSEYPDPNRAAPTRDEVITALTTAEPDFVVCAIFERAIFLSTGASISSEPFSQTVVRLQGDPQSFPMRMAEIDRWLVSNGKTCLILFDALDLFAKDWQVIHQLTQALLLRALGFQSFRAIRTKIFMRPDQFEDRELFRFPDSSKLVNDRTELLWEPFELYGLLLFELMRQETCRPALAHIAAETDTTRALPVNGRVAKSALPEQEGLIAALAGEFMGTDPRRGRVYSWVPLHLADAAGACSPRTFLTVWHTAAEQGPAVEKSAVDYKGIIKGVQEASQARHRELREDYPWMDAALAPLRNQHVPMNEGDFLKLWENSAVIDDVLKDSVSSGTKAPLSLKADSRPADLLNLMRSIGVIERRANGKINVPDIFRVEAGIKRRGGVAVPRRD